MLRFLVLVTLIVGMLAPLGCGARRVTDFTIISTKNTLLVAGAERRQRRVKGEDCVFILFGVPNMKTAVDDAIEKSGDGYDALVDGVILMEDRVLFQCYIVEGTPLRRTDLKQPAPAGDEDPYIEGEQPLETEEGNTFVPRDDESDTSDEVGAAEEERRSSDVAKTAIDSLIGGVKRKLDTRPEESRGENATDDKPPAQRDVEERNAGGDDGAHALEPASRPPDDNAG